MKKINYILLFIINLVIFTITIGYSSFSNLLYVDGMSLSVRREVNIRITGISVMDSDGGSSIYEEYDSDTVVMGVNLSNKDSFVNYRIEVTNYGNIPMGIYSITGINDGLNMEVINYNIKDKICDVSNNCTNGIKNEFYIKISPSEDIIDKGYDIRLDFSFREFHSITYKGDLDGSGFPNEVMDGNSLNIDLSSYRVCDFNVKANGLDFLDYTHQDKRFVVESVLSDLEIELITYDAEIEELSYSLNNLEDASALSATAEGALAEVADMLNRMIELNVMILNSGSVETDAYYINLELEQLVTEINRVCNETTFNDSLLFKGNSFNYDFRGGSIDLVLDKIDADILNINYSYINNKDEAEEYLAKISNAMDIISNYRSYLGSKENQIYYLSDYYENCLEKFEKLDNVYNTAVTLAAIGLDSILDILQRIYEIEIMVVNNVEGDLSPYILEINNLLSNIDIIANGTIVKEYNMLNGSYEPIEDMSVSNLGKDGSLFVNFDDSSNISKSLEDCSYAIEKVNNMKNLVNKMVNEIS